MVHGLEKFREYFGDYTGQYVFIGGTACSILLEEFGGDFRATKDLDVVLIIEELDEAFGEKFWSFIEDGGYRHRQVDGHEQFYRFTHPENEDFPEMVELFSRKPDGMNLRFAAGITPIPTGESIASLSAILLNDDYYRLLLDGKSIVDGYSVLGIEYVVLFKIKAWLDLSERKENGEAIDTRDVKKHRNDIFRLMMYTTSDKIEIPEAIGKDLGVFLAKISEEPVNLRDLGIRSVKFEELSERIRTLFVNASD